MQRASQLARAGRVAAHKEGGRWVINEAGDRRARSGRRYSQRTLDDLVAYLHRGTLEVAAPGYRRQRLAARVRELRESENPAQKLREMFHGAPVPEGPGGAAIVRAAVRGFDEQVRELVNAQHDRYLTTPEKIRITIRDERMIRGMSHVETANKAGISLRSYSMLEECGVSENGNLDGRKVARALGIRAPKMLVQTAVS